MDNYSYNFTQIVNEVEMIWNENINNTGFMFHKRPDIIEIDLSEFNSSIVTSMVYMFTVY